LNVESKRNERLRWWRDNLGVIEETEETFDQTGIALKKHHEANSPSLGLPCSLRIFRPGKTGMAPAKRFAANRRRRFFQTMASFFGPRVIARVHPFSWRHIDHRQTSPPKPIL
jgi:hypothetical protein